MKCPHCQEELKEIAKLTQEELQDYELGCVKEVTAQQQLSREVLIDKDFTDEQMYAYIKACCDSLAEGIFLQACFTREVIAKYGLKQPVVIDGVLYEHN